MKKQIAFFDFDGTITTKDTLLEFIKFYKGRTAFYIGFLVNIPYLIAYKTGIISNQNAKERILAFFFRNTPLSEFQQKCDFFASHVLPGLLRPKAISEIRRLIAEGSEVVVVSASPENWISPWTNNMGIRLLATRLATMNNSLTGRIDGRNCYGEEKVSRITSEYDLGDYSVRLVYGDSRGDLPMLKLGTSEFFKPFR